MAGLVDLDNVGRQRVAVFRVDDAGALQAGDKIDVSQLQVGDKVDVIGISKSKGFAGVVKRHHFAGGPKTHGQSDRHRAPGSIGCSAWPSRVIKGKRMPGHMGNHVLTKKNSIVIDIRPEQNALIVKGGVPGPKEGLLRIFTK